MGDIERIESRALVLVDGQGETQFTIWDLGDNDPRTTELIDGIIVNRTVIALPDSLPDDRPHARRMNLELGLELSAIAIGIMKRAPEETQFLAIGRVSAYAVGLTHPEGYKAPHPRQHPEIDQAIRHHAGEDYVLVGRVGRFSRPIKPTQT
jgi:hypothetical protein